MVCTAHLFSVATESYLQLCISSGTNRQSHHNQLCEFIQTTPVGTVLESVDTENYEEFYKFYLHDFVRSVHRCKHRNAEHDDMEYQVCSLEE